MSVLETLGKIAVGVFFAFVVVLWIGAMASLGKSMTQANDDIEAARYRHLLRECMMDGRKEYECVAMLAKVDDARKVQP